MRPSRTLDHVPRAEEQPPGERRHLRVAGAVVLAAFVALLAWTFGAGLGLWLAVPLAVALAWLLART